MGTKRVGMSKRLRFEILKRDGFRCVYCGASPVRGYLHVDHVIPVVEGGKDEAANLVTSCRDCNLGKGPVPLDESRIEEDANSRDPQAVMERAEQIRAYVDAQRALDAARQYEIDQVQEVWADLFPGNYRSLLLPPERAFVQRLMERFDWEDVTWAMRRSAEQRPYPQQAFKYFCGIAHRWLRDGVSR